VLKQEIVLGIGGIRLLRALGFDIRTFHLNEGHAALLTLDLLDRFRIQPEDLTPGELPYEIGEVRERCVFTTHTPVEAGHDQFGYELFERLLPNFIPLESLKRLAGSERLNMTQLALHLSGYINGVARRHAETTKGIFPGYRVHAITNGIHVETWAHRALCQLYQAMSPNWCHEPELLVRALQLPEEEIWSCHQAAKGDLIGRVKEVNGTALDPAVPIIGFARRMTGYKRPLLLFSDLDRLAAIAARHPFQIVIAGKAHPHDFEGKNAVARIHRIIQQLCARVSCVFAKLMVAGSDLWLNTPLPPLEASGTSGMKAALNGVLNLSILDGWWIEACIEGVTGWSIDRDGGSEASHALALYDKLAQAVLPLYYERPERWRWMMKQAIGYIA
jgi:starch phosphorylase